MSVACIDIGSNTTRLLVAEPDGSGGLRELLVQREFTRLPQARGTTGELTPQKLAQVATAVAAQAAAARSLGATRIRAVATAGVRNAANSHALLEAIRERSGLEVDVLSAQEEARLAFVGASRLLGDLPARDRLAVVDVGGGSSEIAVGCPPTGVDWWVSLPLGSGDLTEAHLASDPPQPAELQAARRHADELFADLHPPPPARAIAVGGSALSLRALVPGACLDGDAFDTALELLCSQPSRTLALALGLDERRVRLLPAGIVVLARAAQTLARPLLIGRGGLREGVVLEVLSGGPAAGLEAGPDAAA